MNWAKHAAEAIVDDEQELAATEAARRRKKLLMTLAGIAGVAGLGALAYNQRENIGEGLNKVLGGGSSDGALDAAGNMITRGAGAAVAAGLPSKAVTSRLPFGNNVASLQKDIISVQGKEKDLSPAAERVAALHKTNPETVDRLNTLLANPKMVNELAQSGREVTPGAPGPLASMSPMDRMWSRIKGGLSGQGFTQSQRDVAALPTAFERLSQPSRNKALQAKVIQHLGLAGTGPENLRALGETGKMLAARQAAPSRYMQAKGMFGTPMRIGLGLAAPEIINGIGSTVRALFH